VRETGVAPAITSATIRPCRWRAGERDERPLASDEILHLHRVANGEDIGVARAHVLIDTDSSALADLDPAIFASAVSGRTPIARITMSADVSCLNR